tara:strand:- start:558 stop:860 length:303 start_codon:yes stop_codon:yes gene_type:complete
MTLDNIKSESIVENLFKEVDFITDRSKAIKLSLKETNNINLKKRLKKEFMTLNSRAVNVQNIVLDIYKFAKDDICLSGLLLEKCNRIRSQVSDNKELFFT